MRTHYIGARYIPLVYEGPDGSPDWLPGVAYEGLTIVKYGNFSYISKKPVPAGAGDPETGTSYWIRASLYNADVEEVRSLLDQKADKDGSYPDLWAGNILTDKYQTDRTPYILRRTGGGMPKIGEREDDTLVGATVNVNQLCNGESVTVPNGHKYYLKKSGTESLGASTGTAITGLTSGSDMVIDLTQNFFSATLSDAKLSTKNIIVQANVMKADSTGWANMVNGEFGFVNDSLRIHNDNYASTADFVANYANGKKCIYELATPFTEQGDPFTSPQIVYPDGTEEFVTENGVPVGHETKYYYSIKGLAEELIDIPEVPEQNGVYALMATRNAAGLNFNWEVL